MVEIRKGNLSDTERIVGLQMQMAKETEGLQLDKTLVSRGVQGVFQEPARGTYWIAEEKDDILGMLLAVPEWSDWRNGTVLWMHSICIVPRPPAVRGCSKSCILT